VKNNEPITIEFGFKERVLQYYFLNKGKVHAYAGAFIAISSFCIAFLTATPSASEANDAKEQFAEWKQAPSSKTLYSEMRASVKKIPGLERSLEAEMAQVLLNDGQIEAAEELAKTCLDRLKKQSPLHAAYASTSFLIEKKDFQKALENSVAIKEEMDKKTDKQSSLYASNLMRIALLQKQVSNTHGELSAWEDVKAVIDTERASTAAKFLHDQFDENTFSLSDYISQRERLIIN
jgi:hypothetical protein